MGIDEDDDADDVGDEGTTGSGTPDLVEQKVQGSKSLSAPGLPDSTEAKQLPAAPRTHGVDGQDFAKRVAPPTGGATNADRRGGLDLTLAASN